MAMVAGNADVDDAGVETTSGMAKAIYDELKVMVDTLGGDSADALVRQGLTPLANALSTALVTYITANAKAAIETTDISLQRDPDTSRDCLGPTTRKTLAIE